MTSEPDVPTCVCWTAVSGTTTSAELEIIGGVVSATLWEELRNIVEMAISRWEEPDSSIWEVRSERKQYVYSKVMCWVAVDRGMRIADRYNLPYDKDAWRLARLRIRRAITSRGYSEHRHSFTQEFDDDALTTPRRGCARQALPPGRERGRAPG